MNVERRQRNWRNFEENIFISGHEEIQCTDTPA